ncbi:hypothetical protein EYF80_020741 [Liparis tanakae]|uniref:Uncharacterized protein n=1 Tax=Liparis tanakae TaxID=230148 RepID=A0A4Z2HTF1_9TELE|nr:hypothetical protein EYF80_020741 [Liparis tanakae]
MVISRSTRSMFWISSSLEKRAGTRSKSGSIRAGLTGEIGSSFPIPRSYRSTAKRKGDMLRYKMLLQHINSYYTCDIVLKGHWPGSAYILYALDDPAAPRGNCGRWDEGLIRDSGFISRRGLLISAYSTSDWPLGSGRDQRSCLRIAAAHYCESTMAFVRLPISSLFPGGGGSTAVQVAGMANRKRGLANCTTAGMNEAGLQTFETFRIASAYPTSAAVVNSPGSAGAVCPQSSGPAAQTGGERTCWHSRRFLYRQEVGVAAEQMPYIIGCFA